MLCMQRYDIVNKDVIEPEFYTMQRLQHHDLPIAVMTHCMYMQI